MQTRKPKVRKVEKELGLKLKVQCNENEGLFWSGIKLRENGVSKKMEITCLGHIIF